MDNQIKTSSVITKCLICNRPIMEKRVVCDDPECKRERQKQVNALKYRKNKNQNLCAKCRKVIAIQGVYCDSCKQAQKVKFREYYLKNKDKVISRVLKNKVNKRRQKEPEIPYSVGVYKAVLSGESTRFPHGFWLNSNALIYAKDITIYLIETVLKWSDEDVKCKINFDIFKKNKLGSMLGYLFKNSPYATINNAYPNKFKPWELMIIPHHFWNDETIISFLEWLIHKLGLENDLLKVRSNLLIKNGFESLTKYLTKNNKTIYYYMDILYPNRFTPEHFTYGWQKSCEICGITNDTCYGKNGKYKINLCGRHRQQLDKYGKIID